jgi:hypothetical protein
MLASLILTVTTLLAVFVKADINPLAPAPGDIFDEGTTCHIAWTVDTSGLWKTTNIELMTGNNFDMIFLTSAYTCAFSEDLPYFTPSRSHCGWYHRECLRLSVSRGVHHSYPVTVILILTSTLGHSQFSDLLLPIHQPKYPNHTLDWPLRHCRR